MLRPCLAVPFLLAAFLTGCFISPKGGDAESIRPKLKVHYVQKGETLSSIGRRYGVPWRKILEANQHRLSLPSDLRPGLPLIIPLHERTEPPRAAPEPATREEAPAEPQEVEPRSVSERSLHRGKPSHPFWWPTEGVLLRSYGDGVRGFWEAGIGLRAPADTAVCAVADGKVVCCVPDGRSPKPGWGNVVSISHADGFVSWYGYLGQVVVKEGEGVKKGERIGTVGSSGAATRPELALRFFKNERPVNPLNYLP